MSRPAPRWQSPRAAAAWICALAAVVVVLFGNPLENAELRWLDRALRWRENLGFVRDSDPHVVHLDITRHDLEQMPTLESEYEMAARIIREAAQRGARVVVFDVIFARGSAEATQKIRDAMGAAGGRNCAVVLAEAELPPVNGAPQRARAFPTQPRHQPAGLINVQADGDGVFRHYRLIHETASETSPSLAFAAYLAWRDAAWEEVRIARGTAAWDELGADLTSIHPRSVSFAPVVLNVRSAWPAGFRHYSPGDLFGLPPASLQNAVVLVSYIAAGVGDLGPTAFGPAQPRVLLHSTALNDLIQNSPLRRFPRWGDAAALLAVALLAAGMPLCSRKRGLFALWLGGLAAIAVGGFALVVWQQLVAPSVATATLWTLLAVGEVARRHTRESAERQRLRATMGLYFSPRVLTDVLKNPGRLEPKRVEITVLLTDLRNSTPLVELLGAEGMLTLLNRVFEVQNRAVFREEGSLETPVGDQFLAYWGAPEPQPDSAERAFRAAVDLIEGMEALHASLEPEVRSLFGFGVGLHAGQSLIGNIGSEQFFHYGLVGDLINSAARVESLTKHYGVRMILTREVYARLASPPPARVLDEVIVKGSSRPLELLEVRPRGDATAFAALCENYAAAFASYRRGDFAAAAAAFEALAETDPPSALLAARCRQFSSAPPDGWQGIFKLETK